MITSEVNIFKFSIQNLQFNYIAIETHLFQVYNQFFVNKNGPKMNSSTFDVLTTIEATSYDDSFYVTTKIAKIFGCLLTVVGFVFNYFCYITADHLPKSSSAILMKERSVS